MKINFVRKDAQSHPRRDNCQTYTTVPREMSLGIHPYTVKMNPFPPQGGSLGSLPASRNQAIESELFIPLRHLVSSKQGA